MVIGALLAWKLGSVGQWVGITLLVRSAFRSYDLWQLVRNPPGTIRVAPAQVSLPRGLAMPEIVVSPETISAVYFLRRSVPWNRSAPVLVVELGDRAMAFPRDWFASEADQRHVIHALMAVVPATSTPPANPLPLSSPAVMWAQVAGGLALLAAGIVGALVTTPSTDASHPLWVAPIAAGFILCWRGITRW